MADKNLNVISSSKYDIYSKELALLASSGYIGSLDEYSKTDFMKATTLGYLTEMMALFQRDSAYHKTIVEKESSLSTATMAKTIYNSAKLFNINVLDATPALRYATFSIDTDTIDNIISNTKGSVTSYKTKYGVAESSNFMIIDKINPIIGGDLYYALEHSLEIYKNASGKYIVKYCLQEQDITTNYGTYNNSGIISTTYQVIDNTKYLVFDVLVAQYKRVESSKIITGSSFIDTKVHTFDYSGQICGLALYYTKGSTTETIDLQFSNITSDDDYSDDDTSKHAIYSIVDDDTIEITFNTNKSSGLPQTGGTLKLQMFITEGYNGNVLYSGDSVISVKQDDLRSFPISIAINTTIYMSGTNQSSLANLKNTIIDKFSTRETIVTENDLNIWFGTQSKLLESVNNSGIVFKKEKDNLLKRTFGTYLLLRDGVSLENYLSDNRSQDITIDSSYVSNVVPTNTIDFTTTNVTSTAEFNITPYDDIKYDVNTQTYTTSSVTSSTDYVYRTPFNINIDQTYNMVSYYYLEVNNSVNAEFENVNYLNNISISPVQLSLYHENGSDSTSIPLYIFTLTVTSDTKLEDKAIKSATIKSSSDTSAINLSVSSLKFESIDTDVDNESTTLYNYKLEIPCSYNSLTHTNNTTSVKDPYLSLNVQQDTSKIMKLKSSESISLFFEFDDGDFSGNIVTTDNITTFTQLDDILKSDLIVSTTNSSATSYTIKGLPVVAKYWMTSDVNKKWFIKQLFIFINMLKANTDKLETTTTFNLKFQNTYGISKYYNVLNTALRLKLNIYIDTDAARNVAQSYLNIDTTTDDEFKASIKNEIMDYIRVCVDNANTDKELIISKIIMNTQASYNSYIKHIDFEGLNGTFNQYIKTTDTESVTDPVEYFSLDETIESDNKSRLEKDIQFTFE